MTTHPFNDLRKASSPRQAVSRGPVALLKTLDPRLRHAGMTIIAAIFFLPFAMLSAQAYLANDLGVYPNTNPPPLPAAGQTFKDPWFGTTILRVTDESDTQATGSPMFVPLYSSIYPAFNANATRFCYSLYNGTVVVADLDVANRKVSNKRYNISPGVTYWDRFNPDLFYTFRGLQILLYNFATGQYTVVGDLSKFSAMLPGMTNVNSRGISDDGNRFEFVPQNASFLPLPAPYDGIYIYDRSLDKIVYGVQAGRLKDGNTKAQMDGSGRYIITAGYAYVDSAADFVGPAPEGGHFEMRLGIQTGWIAIGNVNLPLMGWRPFPFDTGPSNNQVTGNMLAIYPWADDQHFGMQDANGEWMTASGEVDPGYNPPGWQWTWDNPIPPNATGHWTWIGTGPASQAPFPIDRPFEGEIYQLDVNPANSHPVNVVEQWDSSGRLMGVGPVMLPDGTTYPTWTDFTNAHPSPESAIAQMLAARPVNRRIVKHYDDPNIMASPALNYYAQTHAIGSPDNRVILYASNYGNPNRIDLFIAFIDDGAPSTPQPVIFLNSSQLNFSVPPDGTSSSTQTLTVMNTGLAGTTLNWSVAPRQSWLSVSQTSGQLASGAKVSLTVTANLAGLTAGTFPAALTITGNTNNSPQNVTVTTAGGAGGAPVNANTFAVRVYPNPWRADKHAANPQITFNTLSTNVTVKIFTSSGHLVRSLSGNGLIPWDIQNDSGQKVASGVYVYVVMDGQGNKAKGKLAIIK